MTTRKFSENYNETDIFDAFAIAKAIIRQIEYYLNNENLSEMNNQFLEESKRRIEELLEKYKDSFSTVLKISNEQISFGLNEMANNQEYAGLSSEESKRIYENSSETLQSIKKDFDKVFKIEETIHELITIPLWKKSTTSINTEIKPGDKFKYLVHSGEGIIYLPGIPNYRRRRNFEGDYVSASLLSDKQMAMFRNSQVGLIIEANDAIICSTQEDAGTNITSVQGIRTVFKFKEGLYLDAGFPGNLDKDGKVSTTKIQSPNQLEEDTIKNQEKRGSVFSNRTEDVNEVILDDSKIKVIGVFFKTNGCEINLRDFERATMMERLYNVPLKSSNTAIYRRKIGLDPYDSKDYENYIEDVQFWNNPENWEKIINSPEEDRKLIRRYFNEVVVGQEYEDNIKEKIDSIFSKIIEYSYTVGKKGEDETVKENGLYQSDVGE